MGISILGGCSSSPYAVSDSNPDPENFRIVEEQVVGPCLIIHAIYPDATNFEGNKILVYLGFRN